MTSQVRRLVFLTQLMIVLPACAVTTRQRDKATIQDVYAEYITVLGQSNPPSDAQLAVAQVQDNLTPELAAAIQLSLDDLDADPILAAQDYDLYWASTIRVLSVSRRSREYLVCFGDDAHMSHALLVSVKQHGRHSLLDKIEATSVLSCPKYGAENAKD